MKIQIATDYAIRILQYLHLNPSGVHTASAISQTIGVSYPFFIKICNQLKKAGLVHTVQGRNGGYALGRPADKISFYDVFSAIEGEMQISHCIRAEDQHCNRGALDTCRLRGFLCNVQKTVIHEMSQKSLADLVH